MTRTTSRPADSRFDALAWGFLGSDFATTDYAHWPLERRVDAYLAHHGPTLVRDDGALFDVLVDRVMWNIEPARRRGVLKSIGSRPERTTRVAR